MVIKSERLWSKDPEAELGHCPRLLLESADELESNASGMGERKMRWAASEAAGLRYLAALVAIGDYSTAFIMCQEWSTYMRSLIPAAVFDFMALEFPAWRNRVSQGIAR